MVLLQVLFVGTKLGLALRAVAINPESAAFSGLRVGRLLMVGWGLAAGLGAVAGALVAPQLTLTPGMLDGAARLRAGRRHPRRPHQPGRRRRRRLDHRCPREPGRGLRLVHRLRPQGRRPVRPPLRRAPRATPGPVRPEDRGARVMARSTTPPATPATPVWRRPWVGWAVALVVVVVCVLAPLYLPVLTNQTIARVGVFAVAVLGLNVVMGYTGQVSLGQIFFVGLGAYVTAYGVTQGWNVVLVFVLACLLPARRGTGRRARRRAPRRARDRHGDHRAADRRRAAGQAAERRHGRLARACPPRSPGRRTGPGWPTTSGSCTSCSSSAAPRSC